MHICVCLRGIHYVNDDLQIDFRKSNIHEMIINPLISSGHTVDIMCFTYISKMLDELKEYYKPVDGVYLDEKYRHGATWPSQFQWYKSLISTINNYEQTHAIYDMIIITRFDILFNIRSTDEHFIRDKFNILFKLSNGLCDDNFYLFDRKYLNIFDNSINNIISNNKTMHELNRFIDSDILNYVSTKDAEESRNNTLMTITRIYNSMIRLGNRMI